MSAIILAVDIETLRLEAERTNGIIEFTRQVGDFLAVGEPLFLLYGGAAEADDRLLHGAVATGPERTIEQDATFAFRVIVDIAIKALSKAINDPSTAVVALDQLHRLLRVVGRRHLHDDVIMDSLGNPRVIFRTPAGTTSSSCPAGRSGCTAPKTIRWRGASRRCSKTSCTAFSRHATPPC